MSVVTVNGQKQRCAGVGSVRVRVRGSGKEAVEVRACVVDFRPLGYDFVLGMNGILALEGVSVSASGEVSFGGKRESGLTRKSLEVCASALVVEQNDFRVEYESDEKAWTVEWRWLGDKEPVDVKNRVAEYAVPADVRLQYETEVQNWIDKGWLCQYDEEKLGPPRALVPLLAVVQQNKKKVRPVLDFREVNSTVLSQRA